MQIETLNPIKIRVSGEERFDFLQNIITNDLTKLKKELKFKNKVYDHNEVKQKLGRGGEGYVDLIQFKEVKL